MHSMKPIAAWLIPAAILLSPAPSIAREMCITSETDIEISTASPHERALICSGARQALDLLAHCGIAPRWTIDIRVRSEIHHPLAGPIFGYYDLGERYIALTTLDALPGLMQGTPYAGLPPIEFYKSLVVHEVVHSVMHQNLGAQIQSQTAYEYPAYALQIASLPPSARLRFLNAFDKHRIEHPMPLNDTILAFAPYVFAARAYHHFITSSDGCALLRETMKGQLDLVTGAAR